MLKLQLVHEDPQEHKVQQEQLVLKVQLVQLVLREQQDLLVLKVLRVPQEHKVHKDIKEILDQQEHKEMQVQDLIQ